MAVTPSSDDKAIVGKIGSADDVLDILNDDKSDDKDDKEIELAPDKEDKESKEPKEKDDEEIEITEPDEEEPEKLNLEDDKLEIDAPPRKRDILKKYPDIFKDFPFMEKVLYRDRQYTDLFGSFDDAKELAEKAEVFSSFETQLLNGNTEVILKDLKEIDAKAFDKIVDNYLVTLHKVDKEAYFHVVDGVNKKLIMALVEEAKSSGNEDLQQAALVVNQFLFGSTKFTPHQPRVVNKADDEQKDEVEKERLSFLQERFETSLSEVTTQVDNTLRATINEYIDPRNTMTGYVKKNAINDTLNLIHKTLRNDPTTKATLDKLWRAASDSKFSKEATAKIRSFYLGKAKNSGVLASAIKRARAEALKDTTPRNKEDNEEKEERTPARRTGPISSGRPANQTPKGGMKKGESVTDFFARD